MSARFPIVVFLSLPINFNDICYIYPAKVKDIVWNENFPAFRSLLTSSQEDLQDLYTEKNIQDTPPTPFEYLLSLYYGNGCNSVQFTLE